MSYRIPVFSFPEDLPEASSLSPTKKHKTIVYLIKLLHGSGYTLAAIYALAILVIKPLIRLSYDRRLEFSQFVFDKLSQMYKGLTMQTKLIPSVIVNYKGVVYKDSITSTDDREEDHYVVEMPSRSTSWTNFKSKEVRFSDGDIQSEESKSEYKELALESSDRLAVNLIKLKTTLNNLDVPGYKASDNFQGSFISRFNGSSLSEMHPLLFQVKQFKNYLEVTTSDHPRDYLFKRNISYRSVGYGNNNSANAKHRSLNMVDDIGELMDDMRDIVKQKKMQGIQ